MSKPLEILYDSLKRENFDVPDTYDSFEKTLTASGTEGVKNRQTLYDSLKRENFDVPDTYDSFSKTLFVPVTKPENNILGNQGSKPVTSADSSGDNLSGSMQEGTPAVSMDGDTEWKPTAQQKAAMMGSVQSVAATFKAQADETLERSRNIAEYTRRGGGITGQPVEGDGKVNPETGQVEKTYITPTGAATRNKSLAERDTRAYNDYADNMTIAGQLRRASRELDDLNQKILKRTREISSETSSSEGKPFFYNPGFEKDARLKGDSELKTLEAARRQVEERIGKLGRKRDAENGEQHGYWRGFLDVISDINTWGTGEVGLQDTGVALDINNKINKGEKLTDSENRYMSARMENDQTDAKDGWMYRMGLMTGEMIPFMLDFALMGGSKSGASGMSKALTGYLERKLPSVAANKIGKWSIKVLGTMPEDLLVKAPAMSNTVQAGATLEDIASRKLGDVTKNEDGTYDFSNDKSWGSAIWQGEANSIIENYSEMFGTHLEGALSLKAASKVADVFGAKRISDLLSKASSGELAGIAATAQKQLNRLGVSDYFGEVGEEYYGQLWRTILNLDDAKGQDNKNLFLDPQFHADIWGGMALSMGMIGAGKYTISAAAYGSMKHRVNKSDRRAAEIFTPEIWDGWRERIDGTTNDDIADVAASIYADPQLNKKQRDAAMDYMEASLNLRGLNLASVARQRGGEESPEEMAVNENYMDGYSATEPEEMNDVRLQMEQKRDILVGSLGEDAVAEIEQDPIAGLRKFSYDETLHDSLSEFVNARMVYDGMIQRVRDDIDGRIAQSDTMIENRINSGTGMIQPATVRDANSQEGRQVYIVDGNVAMFDDGSGVDIGRSSKSIIIRDAESGKAEFASPDQFLSVSEGVDADEEKESARQQIRQEIARRAADNIDGVISFDPGRTYPILDSEGNQTEITILQQSADEDGLPAEGMVDIRLADGNVLYGYPMNKLESEISTARTERVNRSQIESDPKISENVSEGISETTETVPEYSETVPGIEEGVRGESDAAEQANAPVSAISRIPVDKNGDPDYDQVEPDIAWDALLEQTEGDADMARGVIEQTIAEKEEELKKISKQRPLAGLTVAQKIQAAKEQKSLTDGMRRSIDHWKSMGGTMQRREAEGDAIRREEAARRKEENRVKREAERVAQEEAERIEREALNGVPDWSHDSPKDARSRGFRRVGPEKVDRQENVAAAEGKEVEVKFADNELAKGHAGLIEADTLQPSHIQGSLNPRHFISEGQPKNREDAASVSSAARIAGNIRPEEITSSVTAYTGAPTVNRRGETIQGNSRSDALRLMYESYPEQAAKYKQYLADHAADFGLDAGQVASMERPVLVNMLDVDDNEAIRLGQFVAQDTESGGIERLKPTNMIQKMGEEMSSFSNILLRADDDEASVSQLIDANGADTMQWLARKGHITETQYQSAFDSKGNLTPEAKNDLQGMLYENIFTGGSTQLKEMFGKIPVKAQRAILATAHRDRESGQPDRIKEELQQSIMAFNDMMNYPDVADATDLKSAIRAVDTWSRQYAFDEVTGESHLPSKNFSNFALRLAALYKGGSQKLIQQTFNDLFDSVQGTEQGNLFEEAERTPKSLGEAIGKVLDIEYQPINRIENGNNGSDVVDIDTPEREAGRPGGEGDAGRGERATGGEGLADSGRGTEDDRPGGRERGNLQSDRERQRNLQATETDNLNYRLSNEVDENGRQFVVSENGTTSFGVIREESGLPSAPIKLSEGYQDENGKGYGLRHIEAGHGVEIRNAGFPSVEEFVSYVAKNYDKDNIRIGKQRRNGNITCLIQVTDSHDNTLFIELSRDGSYWNVNSGGVFRKGYSDKKETVAKTEPQQPNNAVSSDSSLPTDEQSGTSSIEPNGESTVSDSKVNNSAPEKQGSDQESSVQPSDNKGAPTFQAAVEAASAQVNTDPTPSQAKAGNYKKGHVTIGEFDITIENPAGSVRKGVDANGKQWETTMANTYGYIKGTEGVDGDHIDVFLHSDMDQWNGRKVFVVDQTNTDGSFDEHKVMLGFNDKDEAMTAYLANYDKTWADTHTGLRISETNIEDFNKWVESSHRKTKPFADYTTVSKVVDESPVNAEPQQPERPTANISDGYKIEPKPYTNRQGKTLDTYLVTFDRDFSKQEKSSLRTMAKEKRGWADKESGGWMLRSRDDAEAFAKNVMSKSDTQLSEEAPLSLDDMRSATKQAPAEIISSDNGAPDEKKPVNPSGNKLVTDEQYADLLARMRRKMGGQLNMGVDPEILAIGSMMAVYHIEKGARKFAEYVKAMVADLGEKFPARYLKGFYKAAHEMIEDAAPEIAEEMDSDDIVNTADVASIISGHIDAMATAEMVAGEETADREREEAEKNLKEERNVRLNPDGSTTETIKEGDVEIEVTKGDFIPGVRPFVENGNKPDNKRTASSKSSKSKPAEPKPAGAQLDLFGEEDKKIVNDIAEESRLPEPKPEGELSGDSAGYQERRRQERDLVDDIAIEIMKRADMKARGDDKGQLTMRDVRGMLENYDRLADISATDLQELVERAMTILTRTTAKAWQGDPRRGYDRVVAYYNAQPSLNARDSERLIKQQYSTPTPFGYVMGQFVNAGHDVRSVLEPSAGNGALTIMFDPSAVHVNDIDERRLENLRALGYGEVTAQNGLLPFEGERVDAVMTNPPFGTVTERVYDGMFKISSLEGQMAINALDSMKDDGRAAIIIGGNTNYRTNGSMNPKDAAFFGYLYSHYKVADVINISGKALYSRNGTGYDVRMILINGRKTGEFRRVFPPVRSKARAEQVTTFDELYKRVEDDIQQIYKMGDKPADDLGNSGSAIDGGKGTTVRKGSHRQDSGAGERPGATSQGVGSASLPDIGQPVRIDEPGRPVGMDNGDGGNAGSPDNVQGSKSSSSGDTGNRSTNDDKGGSGGNGRGPATSRPNGGGERLAIKRDLNTEKVPYPNQSENGFTLLSVVPAAQAEVLQRSLGEIGDVDQFLVNELGYSSKDELYGYLAAEQIDSVALAIHQMNKGNAFIIGDMTGVGKGRQGAALIRYAVKQGKCPIYFTQKPTLFTDNYRDLTDIGSSGLRPFIIASNPKDANIVDANGNIVHKLPSQKERERVYDYILKNSKLPSEYDYVLTTYDQIKNGTEDYTQNEDGSWNRESRKLPKKSKGYTTADTNGQIRRDVLAQLALGKPGNGNIAILDESHTVGGDSGCGRYMQMLTSNASGVTFLSATFAKRADNMPIYAQRTAISEAGVKANELIEAIAKGGVTLQEIMSKQLVESGQMIRRERSFEGVTIDWLNVAEETDKKQREQFNEVANIFNSIRNFQNDYIKPIIEGMNEAAAEQGATVGLTHGTKDLGVRNTPFASKMYNLVNQLLFALKVDAVADRVIENLKNGFKPVISFTNTMEGFLASAPKGVPMNEVPNFSLTLMRALDGVMRYTEVDADTNSEGGHISLSQLSPEGQNAYNAVKEKIMNLSANLSISPMDAIRMKIEEAGYSVAEITGRTTQLNKTEDGRYIVEARKDRDKKSAMRDFNSGKLDVLMINKSGSTGISLHASSKFEDQRQRVMVFAQFQSDINDEVQMRGRIDRSGQVVRGRYEYIMSTIPAEQRIQMMFKAKLKSLDANTTSSQKSKFNEMEIVDYLNKYGDEVVWEYMKEHPELSERLGDPLKMLSDKKDDEGARNSDNEDTSLKSDCAGKISRYLAFLSVEEQDEIFKEITEAYKVKLQLLDDAGENDLEITTMPLRAETKNKQIWHQGENPGSGNAFADNTYVEEVEVDVLKKPMKRSEIEGMTRKLMGDKVTTATQYDQTRYGMKEGELNWNRYADKVIDEVKAFFSNKSDEAIEKMKEAGVKRVAKAREKAVKDVLKARSKGENTFSDQEIESLADVVAKEAQEKEDYKQYRRREEINAVRDRIKNLFSRLHAGHIYVVPQDLKQASAEMFTQTFGAFVGFKFNKSYTLGSSTAIFATLDGRRKVELALNDKSIDTIIRCTDTAMRYSPKEINAISMDNWDSKVPTQTRQKRYIITGNLLQALVDTEKGERTKGNLISFSTKDGDTRQGILMSENFKPTDLRSSVPLRSRLGQIRNGETVVSESGEAQIEKVTMGWDHRGDYELRVPKSKQKGGLFTMHPELLKLVEGRNFVTKGNHMVAYVGEGNIAKVVDMLSQGPFNLTVLEESRLEEPKPEDEGTVRYRLEETGDRIEKLFEDAIAGNLKGKPVEIGRLTEEGRDYLERLSGLSFKEEVSFVLNPSDLMHIYKGHFGKNEKDKGQNIPLDKEDIRNLAGVISDPDKVVYLKEEEGLHRNMFYFFKEATPGTYNLMEIYSDRKGNLTAKTFYKTRKDATQRVMDIKKSLLPTSETYFGAILSDGANLPKFFELSTDEDAESLERAGTGAYGDAEVSMGNDPWSRAWGESLRTSRQQREYAARERRRMRDRAESLSRTLGVDIEVIEDSSTLKGKKQGAKGWYDIGTGRISVVVGNNLSVADMEATILHEAVAHHGLRKLFGEKFDDFLDAVFDNAESGIKERISLLASRNGWNRRVATEEYLAGLAEDTDFGNMNASWWSKIKRLFMEFLRNCGFDVDMELSDNELRYVLWMSWKNLRHPGAYRSFLGEAERIAKEYELRVGRYSEDSQIYSESKAAEAGELYELNERFNKELDDQIAGRQRQGHVYDMGMPSDYLLSTGIANLPIKLSAKTLNVKSHLERHEYDLGRLKNLVYAIRKPWAIFSYGDRRKAQNMIIGIEDNGRQFLVGLSINPTVKGRVLEINSIRNVFPKNNHEWVNWITEGKLLRVDEKEKIQAIIAKLRMNPVAFDYLDLDVAAKIVENFENPTIIVQNNNKPEDEGIRFRDGDFTAHDRVLAAKEYERMLSQGSWQFREATQDSMLGLKTLYQSILGRGHRIENVAGYENAYLYENRMSSANNGEQHQYFSRFMKPLLKSIHELCGSKELERRMLTDYMIAKHGLERNEHMRNEAAANGEKSDRDFAGLCGLTGEDDWKEAERLAQEMVDDYEADHDTMELWGNVKKATDATLEKLYLSGMISEDTRNKVLGMYDYYIPLRGWDETTSDEVYGYLTSKDGPLMGNVFKTAEGRSSKADDPVATIAMMADDAIRQGNRNIMKQRFLNFAQGHPSDLVSVSEMWLQHNDVTDEWEPVFADLEPEMTHEEVESAISKFEARMETLRNGEPDKYRRGRDARNIPYKVVSGNLNEHQVLVKRNGRTYVMTINGNPRAAQALNGLTNPNVDMGGVVGNLLKLGEYVNRHLSAFYTTRNPDFVVSNFLRDMLYSNCMTWVKENPRYALRFHRNFGKVNPIILRRLLSKWEEDSLSDRNYLEKMFKEFMLNGGETGYTSVKDIEGHKRTIASELKKEGSTGRKAWSALGMQLDLLNRSAENCARFAAFLTSREMGRTLDRSIHDAKEISVNFNKKGSGGKFVNATGQKLLGKLGSYLGGGGRIAFVFWNAGIQGMTNFGRAAKRHPGKASGGAAALFTLGYVVPLLAQMLGGGDGDDDDKNAYYNLPEYVRRSNICLKAGEQWITIPLPIEYRAIYGMGELACGVISGNERYSDPELTRQMAAQISQVMPLDMLEGGGGITPFIPSAFKPYTEAYIMNKGWTGLPVYKETPFNKNDPEWTKAYQSADQHLVDFARWLNETSGGNDYKKGSIDINPAKIEYLLSGTFGGVVSTTEKLKKMGETAFSDREFEWRNMLLANRVIKSGDERTANRKLQNEYFKYKDESEETGRLLRKYENAADEGILGYAKKADFLYNSPEYLRYEIFQKFKGDIDAINEELKGETDSEVKKGLQEELYGTMRELVEALHSVGKEKQ